MAYKPTVEKVNEAIEYSDYEREKYQKANRLLEQRIIQLLNRGRIFVHKDILDIINNRNINAKNSSNVDFTQRFFYRHVMIGFVGGIEETIASTDDKIAKFLYKRCKELGSSAKLASDTACSMYCNLTGR